MATIDERITDQHLGMALPRQGYLRDYIEYGCSISMAPAEYHLAGGLVQMAALLGNRVTAVLGGRSYPPHLWVIVLGAAGAKKSTALALAAGLLDEVSPDSLHLPQETSREQLWQLLSDRPTGYMVLGEFLAFMAKSTRDYMSGLKEDLCEVWDSPAVMEKALRSSKTTIKRPAVSIMGAAVPDALGEWVKQRDLSGGFLSRFLFVNASSPLEYRGMVEYRTPARIGLKATLKDRWHDVPKDGTKALFSPETTAVWEQYDQEVTALETPAELAGFVGRCGTYALKLAVCYAFAETGKCDPTPEHMYQACGFVEYSRRQVWRMLDDLDPSRDAQDLRRTKAMIGLLSHGNGAWVSSRDLLRRLHLFRRRFDELIETLAQSGQVELRDVRTGQRGPVTRELRLTGYVTPKPVTSSESERGEL